MTDDPDELARNDLAAAVAELNRWRQMMVEAHALMETLSAKLDGAMVATDQQTHPEVGEALARIAGKAAAR